jgi:hypothetical protein
MLSNCYKYCLIIYCCVRAVVEITALFAEAGSDSLMEVETHNLVIVQYTILCSVQYCAVYNIVQCTILCNVQYSAVYIIVTLCLILIDEVKKRFTIYGCKF